MSAFSFRKLFAAADEACGFALVAPPSQRSTEDYLSSFDKRKDDDDAIIERFHIPKSDLEQLKVMAQKVTAPPEDENVVLGIYAPDLIEKYSRQSSAPSTQNVVVGLGDWTDELQQIMGGSAELVSKETRFQEEYDSDAPPPTARLRAKNHASGHTQQSVHYGQKPSKPKYTPFHRQRTLDGDLAPFHVFDPDLVDLRQMKDPLNRYIPNCTVGGENDFGGIDDHGMVAAGPTLAADPTAGENPIRSSIFHRHGRLQHEPNMELGRIEDDSMTTKFERDRQRKLEKVSRIKQVQTLFDATATLIKSANKRNRDSLQRSFKSGNHIAALNHSQVAATHKNTKPDLMEVDLKYFHRPRMIRERDRAWHIHVKKPASHAKKGADFRGGSGSGSSSGRGTDLTRIVHKDQDKLNLSLADNDYPFVMVEYVEECLPVVLNYGMASAIFNYFRSTSENDQDDDASPDTAGSTRKEDDKSTAPTATNSVVAKKPAAKRSKKEEAMTGEELASISKTLEENQCRLPKHVMLLLSLRSCKRPYEFDATIPRFKLGQTKVLSVEDDSPFLGNIEPGDMQPALCNNLFQAPIFPHAMPTTDFLLIRTKLSQTEQHFRLREVPHLFLSGQVEPLLVVPRPANKLSPVQEKFYQLSIVRELARSAEGNGIDYQDLYAQVLKYCAKEKASPHKATHRVKFRDFVQILGEADDREGRQVLVPREFASPDVAYQFASETLAKTFTAEEVCLQESCNAAEYRLFQQHVTDIDLGKVQRYLQHMHKVKVCAEQRLQAAHQLLAELRRRVGGASGGGLSSVASLATQGQDLLDVLNKDLRRKERTLQIARFIFDRLIQAPWNTSEAFVKSILEKDDKGRMIVQGVGDPSGRGEGFAFVRIPRAHAPSQRRETVKLVGTDKDLRKLTKVDAIRLLVAFGVKASEAEKLQRWDRIHMIREYCNNMDKMGLVPKELQKYVRDTNNNNMAFRPTEMEDREDHFKKICQDIWNAQKKALSLTQAPVDTMSKEARKREQQRTRMLKATAAGASGVSSAGSDELDESDDDDEDEELDLEGALAARRAAAPHAAPDAAKKRMEEDRRELSQLNDMLAGGHDDLLAAVAGGPPAAPAMHVTYPKRVVRRLTRTTDADGKETLRIEFVFSEVEVRRVETAATRQIRERQQRRMSLTAFTDSTVSGRKAEDLPASMSINLDKLKKGALKKSDGGAGGAGGGGAGGSGALGGGGKNRRKSGATVDDERDADGEGDYTAVLANVKKNRAKTALSTLSASIQTRLPKVALAALLEKEVMELWTVPHAQIFQQPVDPMLYPRYRDVVTHPVCLSDIARKTATYEYARVDEMVADVQRMVANCEAYNGRDSVHSVGARKLLELLRKNLDHERKHFQHDTLKKLEDSIQAQQTRLAAQRL